jgi:subtilisin-like proprotein convertase family protein
VNRSSGADTWPPGVVTPVTSLDTFYSQAAEGNWYLYVYDDLYGDIGSIAGGWSLTITTGNYDLAIPGTGQSGPASLYPRTFTFDSTQVVTDVDVKLEGLTHQRPDDLDVLLVGPTGAATMLVSDACGNSTHPSLLWIFDDEASGQLVDDGAGIVCSHGRYRPVDYGGPDSMPGVAPPGPYATSLEVFDGTLAGGAWKLYIADDEAAGRGASGHLVEPPTFTIKTRAKATTQFSAETYATPEGAPVTAVVTRSASGTLGPASVRVTSTLGTAGGSDFVQVDQVLTFARGQVSRTVTVPTVRDTAEEGPETFNLHLSSEFGDATRGARGVVQVTILPPDEIAPQTILRRAPSSGFKRTAKLRFTSSEDGTFRCKVDKKAWKPCTSPLRLKKLKVGKHTVFIRAVDTSGNVDATPLKVVWRVKPRR